MKTLLALLPLSIALALAPVAAAAPWAPDVRGARAYAAQRSGQVSFAVRTPGAVYGHRGYRTVRSASVVKAMLLVAYLNRAGVRNRPLRAADRALLSPMIRRSDNTAASRVRDVVGYGSLYRLARRAGMRRFAAGGSWGATRVCAADQARLFLNIDRYVVARHRATALELLGSIVPSQRWGIARVAPQSWALHFKGGWGDGRGDVDHQVALLRRGRGRISVAILTTSNPSHRYGKETLRGVARRLLHGLRAESTPR